MKAKIEPIRIKHAIRRSCISIAFIVGVIFLINISPNYVKEQRAAGINLIINNNNVTKNLKNSIYEKDGEYYLSTDDFKNFFDEFLIEDTDNIITTSNTKTVKISRFREAMTVNGSNVKVKFKPFSENEKTYLSIKEMASVYNFEYDANKDKEVVIISPLNKKLVQGTVSKKIAVKLKATPFSRTLEKVDKGEKVTLIQDTVKNENIKVGNYVKVRTSTGTMGYVKESNLSEVNQVRDDFNLDKIDGKVSIVWDYYTQYTAAPKRSDKIEGVNVVSPSYFELREDSTIIKNVDNNYTNWAHNNGYKVWPTLSNSFLNNLDAVSKMMETFDTRAKLIDNIVNAVVDSNVDGVNVDFENMYKQDKDKFSRFIIELRPRLKDYGKTLSVIVTEPDGSDTWSLCYDRHTLGRVADYLVFMGYDQHNASSKVAGSVASYDWVELNINKFLGQEGVDANKLVLSMPFYTRLWSEKDGQVTSKVVNMKDVKIPENVTPKWDENARQNYYEYQRDGITYKMWIEDEKSISEKLELVKKYNLSGAGFWEKDRETSGVWNIVKEKLEIK